MRGEAKLPGRPWFWACLLPYSWLAPCVKSITNRHAHFLQAQSGIKDRSRAARLGEKGAGDGE
jgi:hypothetical protein